MSAQWSEDNEQKCAPEAVRDGIGHASNPPSSQLSLVQRSSEAAATVESFFSVFYQLCKTDDTDYTATLSYSKHIYFKKKN